jgi:hypothetical protein
VHSRAYINFKKPEDVIDFYEDFNGHVFVNERGTYIHSFFKGPAVKLGWV